MLALVLGVPLALLAGLGGRGHGADDGPVAPPSPRQLEFRKARTAFVASVSGIAARARDVDPGLERRALRAWVLGDDDAGARARLSALGEAPPDAFAVARGGRHVPPWVATWRDLVVEADFGAGPAAERFVPFDRASAFTRTVRSVETGPRYVLELETRWKPAGPGWMVGLAFGASGGGGCTAFVTSESVVLDEYRGGAVTPIKAVPHAGLAVDAWHTLAVVVDGGRVDVWLDGQPYLKGLTPSDADLGGDVSVLSRDVTGGFRAVALGRAP